MPLQMEMLSGIKSSQAMSLEMLFVFECLIQTCITSIKGKFQIVSCTLEVLT